MNPARAALLLAACASLLLAGCVSDAPTGTSNLPAGAPRGNPPSTDRNETGGLEIDVAARPQYFDATRPVTVTATVTNRGEDAKRINEICASTPWVLAVHDAKGNPVRTEPVQVQCLALGLPVPFPRGESLSFNWTWNGTHYPGNPEYGEQGEPAPEGWYVVTVTFDAERDGKPLSVNGSVAIYLRPEWASSYDPRHGGRLMGPPSAENRSDDLFMTGEASARAFFPPNDTYSARFKVQNQGADAQVHGLCESPWRVHVEDEAGQLLRTAAPTAGCDGFTLEPFPRGATLDFTFTWDGNVYDDEGRASRVPDGEYIVRATFTAWEGEKRRVVEVAFPVGVLSPDAQPVV